MPVVGETKDAGFQIGVSRTYPIDRARAWAAVTGPGLPLWLGLDVLPTEKGASYVAADGTTGEVRSFHRSDRVRLTWRGPGWSHDTTVQMAVSESSGKTVVRFHQERLADGGERSLQRQHWKAALDRLDPLLGSAPDS